MDGRLSTHCDDPSVAHPEENSKKNPPATCGGVRKTVQYAKGVTKVVTPFAFIG